MPTDNDTQLTLNAKAARNLGAEVYRFTRVTDTKPRPDGSWDVITDKGNLVAEHVVNAGGLWARDVGRFAGLELPILAMEHQYLITGEMGSPYSWAMMGQVFAATMVADYYVGLSKEYQFRDDRPRPRGLQRGREAVRCESHSVHPRALHACSHRSW